MSYRIGGNFSSNFHNEDVISRLVSQRDGFSSFVSFIGGTIVLEGLGLQLKKGARHKRFMRRRYWQKNIADYVSGLVRCRGSG